MEINGSCEVVMGVEPLVTASVGDVPDSERLVIRGREEILAPGVPGDASDPVVVPH